jgi:hypothetical protein
MWNGLEKRISRLEKRVAERTEKNKVCNCRVETRFHNADCLDAVLKGMSRVCSVHGFRKLGFFFWTSKQYLLQSEDNQFCPCPPHPWRSFLLSEGPHTWAPCRPRGCNQGSARSYVHSSRGQPPINGDYGGILGGPPAVGRKVGTAITQPTRTCEAAMETSAQICRPRTKSIGVRPRRSRASPAGPLPPRTACAFSTPTPTKLPNWAGSGTGAIVMLPAKTRVRCRPWTMRSRCETRWLG